MTTKCCRFFSLSGKKTFKISEILWNIVLVFRPSELEGYSDVGLDAVESFEGNFHCVEKISPRAQFMGKENFKHLLQAELTSYVATCLFHFVSLKPA